MVEFKKKYNSNLNVLAVFFKTNKQIKPQHNWQSSIWIDPS